MDFYDYKDKGLGQVRILPSIQSIGRINRTANGNDIYILDHIDLLKRNSDVTDSAMLMMKMMQRKMKIFERVSKRKKKILNIYETNEHSST